MCMLRCRLIALFMIVALIGLAVDVRGQSQTPPSGEVLTLEQAVAVALRDNPQIKNAQLDISKTRAEFAASRTRRLPSFNFEMQGSQQLTPIDFTFERGVFAVSQPRAPLFSRDVASSEVSLARRCRSS